MTDRPPSSAARRPLRRAVFAVGVGLPVLLVLVCALAWARLSAAPLVLPVWAEARVTAALDAQMAANDLSLERISVGLEGGRVPEIAVEGIVLSDPEGQPRAAFPALRVHFSPQALLGGTIRPTRIDISDAGLRLSRDAEGRLDLELTEGNGATLNLEDTLDRIDAMFAATDFVELDAITGTGLNLAMADAMTGQVMRVRDAEMRLERKDGAITLRLGGGLEGTRAATLDLAITRNAPRGFTDLGLSFTNLAARDLATASPALAWLDLMRAPISGRLVARLADSGAVGDLSGELQIGAGQLSIDGVAAPLAFEAMAAQFSYASQRQRILFERLDVAAPELSFRAEGHADVSDDGAVFTSQFRLSGIAADPRGVFSEPLMLDGAAVDLRLTLSPDLQIEIGQAVVFDDDLTLRADGRIVAEARGVQVALDARIAEATSEVLMGYWPVDGIPNTRRWIETNLRRATLSGIDFAFRQEGDRPADLALGFDFEGAEVQLLRDQPPLQNGAGYLSLTGPSLVVRVDDGEIAVPGGGALAMGGSVLVIPNTRMRGPHAEIDLAIGGALQDVLTLLAAPPVNLLANADLGIARLGEGQADLAARIETRFLPRVPLEEIAYSVEGVVRDYRAEALIPGRVLEAERLRISASPEAVAVQGQARFDGVEISGQWGRALGPDAPAGSRVDARAMLDRAALAQVGIVLPDWLMSGRGAVDLAVALLPGQAPELQITSDLSGIGLALPPLGWRLGQGQSGAFSADIRLGPDPQVQRMEIEAGGLSFAGRADLESGRLQRLVADRLRLGTWLDVTGRLQPQGGGAPPAIAVTGGVVDLRGAPQTGGAGGAGAGAGGRIEVALDRLQVTDTIAVRALTAVLGTGGGLSGEFRGRVNGTAPITGTLSPMPNGPAVRIRAEDGGAVLRAAGLLRNVHGGAMELILAATGAPGSFNGQVTMSGPRLRDAPVMAELLNLVSVVGLLEQLSGEGINLGEVEARFTITPSQIRLTRGSAVGPSMGLSMDGAYNVASRQIDMQGVISPFYVVNGLFGALLAPRREGLFGFSYRLTGTPDQMSVSVNPLSILTPGIFREIFRRPPPAPVETQ
jgi:hypothetical protein